MVCNQCELCLRRCPELVNAVAYLSILGTALPFTRNNSRCETGIKLVSNPLCNPLRATGKKVVFLQDGASVHTAKTTMQWLKDHKVEMLNNGIWPSMSPDLNPVEHVWPRQLRDRVFNTRGELWAALEFAFAQVSKNDILRLNASMNRRCCSCNGAHTKY